MLNVVFTNRLHINHALCSEYTLILDIMCGTIFIQYLILLIYVVTFYKGLVALVV